MKISDQQTNLAQTHSHLSYSRMERLPPRRDGQLVSYPATAWFKKKRQYLMNDRYALNIQDFISKHPISYLNLNSSTHLPQITLFFFCKLSFKKIIKLSNKYAPLHPNHC